MSLTLHYHPLSSFCQKVLVALYENAVPFTLQKVDMFDPAQHAALLGLWPIGKFPVLRDDARDRTVAESSIIIEYLDLHHPGMHRMIPADAASALHVRARDRFLDLHIHMQFQKIVGDALRPEGGRDPLGVADARAMIQTALGMLDREMAGKMWGMGDAFTLADCAAAPILFYLNEVVPLTDTHLNLAIYLDRLLARPSFARVVEEAQPYLHMFPKDKLS